MDYLSTAWTAVYYIACPILYILHSILVVLANITAPLLHLVHYSLYACGYALRIIGKFESLYIFFGIAALVGILTGTSLHYISGFIISALNLDSSPEGQRGRTLASYRAEKQARRDAKDPITNLRQKDDGLRRKDLRVREEYMNWNSSKQDRGRGGNRFNTILEEEDTSDGF